MPYVELSNRLYVGPNYIDLGAPDGRIWEARFDLMPLSDGSNSTLLRSYLSACGLTLTRASTATVQTSASTVVPSGIGVDDPRVGDAGYGRGLVVEESRTNLVQKARDLSVGTGWNVGTATPSLDFAAGPDGSAVADRFVCASGQYSTYWGGTLAAGTVTASQWVRATSGTINTGWELVGATGSASEDVSVSTTWQRRVLSAVVTAGAGAYVPVSGRTNVGLTATARDSIVDLHQIEAGKFATEAIITTGAAATRSADRLAVSSSRLIRSGRIGLAVRATLKGSIGGSNDYSADPYLWRYDASNYATINRTTGAVTVVIAGGSYTTASGFTAAANDVVDYWVEAGGGGLQTVVKARKSTDNGATWGAVTTLGTGAAQGTHPSATSMDLMSDAGSAQLSAWIQSVQGFVPGRRPAWT